MQGKVGNLSLQSLCCRQDWECEDFEHQDSESVLMCVLMLSVFYWEYIHWKIKSRRTNLQNVVLLHVSVSKSQSIHIPSVLQLVTWQNWILIPGKTEYSFILCRGGLAERLCRLQNRERSAISFWRHQCISDAKIPSGKKHYTYTSVWKYILTWMYTWPA